MNDFDSHNVKTFLVKSCWLRKVSERFHIHMMCDSHHETDSSAIDWSCMKLRKFLDYWNCNLNVNDL